jgi:hypothetical protein
MRKAHNADGQPEMWPWGWPFSWLQLSAMRRSLQNSGACPVLPHPSSLGWLALGGFVVAKAVSGEEVRLVLPKAIGWEQIVVGILLGLIAFEFFEVESRRSSTVDRWLQDESPQPKS